MHPRDQGVFRTLGVDDQMQLVGSPHFRSPAHLLLPSRRPELAALLQVLSICSAQSLLEWVGFQLDALLLSSFRIAFSPCLHAWVCL